MKFNKTLNFPHFSNKTPVPMKTTFLYFKKIINLLCVKEMFDSSQKISEKKTESKNIERKKNFFIFILNFLLVFF